MDAVESVAPGEESQIMEDQSISVKKRGGGNGEDEVPQASQTAEETTY